MLRAALTVLAVLLAPGDARANAAPPPIFFVALEALVAGPCTRAGAVVQCPAEVLAITGETLATIQVDQVRWPDSGCRHLNPFRRNAAQIKFERRPGEARIRAVDALDSPLAECSTRVIRAVEDGLGARLGRLGEASAGLHIVWTMQYRLDPKRGPELPGRGLEVR